MHRGKVDPLVSELPRGNELSRDHVNKPTRLPISGAFWNFLLENLFQTLIMSMRKTTLAPGQLLRFVDIGKSYLGKVGYPVVYNG